MASPTLANTPIADVICEPTPALHKKLTQQFGERRAATGLRGPEEVLEVWTSARGNWTLVMRYAGGTSCIVAMGEHWSLTTPEASG
ncbi:MAG: hypothetical protein AAGA05_01230 [Pseudomonadota bacterium]